jgi:hypothetical protein
VGWNLGQSALTWQDIEDRIWIECCEAEGDENVEREKTSLCFIPYGRKALNQDSDGFRALPGEKVRSWRFLLTTDEL